MKAIVLCAGQGQRLYPMTKDCPKGMVKVGGIPILERQLQTFRQFGIDDISVIGGHKEDSIRYEGIKKYVNKDYASTNMVHTLFCANQELNTESIISYADILYHPKILESLKASKHDISVVVDLDWESYFAQRAENILDDAETLKLSGDKIVDIGGKADTIHQIEGQYIGLMKFSRSALSMLHELYDDAVNSNEKIGWGRPATQAYMTDLLQECIKRGHDVHAVPIHGGWCEVDTLEDHALAELMLTSIVPQGS